MVSTLSGEFRPLISCTVSWLTKMALFYKTDDTQKKELLQDFEVYSTQSIKHCIIKAFEKFTLSKFYKQDNTNIDRLIQTLKSFTLSKFDNQKHIKL